MKEEVRYSLIMLWTRLLAMSLVLAWAASSFCSILFSSIWLKLVYTRNSYSWEVSISKDQRDSPAPL
jgi:hypothetical protein